MPSITRMQGLTATAGLALALFACSESEVKSDLNADGPPRVITVTLSSETAALAGEDLWDIATYCADPSVEKMNPNYCPADPDVPGTITNGVTDTLPLGWEMRVMFNELLLAEGAETLIPCTDNDHDGQCGSADDVFLGSDGEILYSGSLVDTQPVTLRCAGEDIPYDVYYQPAGSHLTLPGGPALVIQPMPGAFAATSAQCEVTVNSSVQSKDSEGLTSGAGPFSFQIAPLAVYQTDPADGAQVATDAQLALLFNAPIDAASLGADTIEVTDDMGTVHATAGLAFDDVVIVVSDEGGFVADTNYTLTVKSGVRDVKGGAYTGDYVLTFSTLP